MVRFAPHPGGPRGKIPGSMNADSNNSMKLLLRGLTAAIFFTVVAVAFADIETGFVPEPEDPAIAYGTRPTTDRISTLNREIEAGRAQLKFDGEQGYLRSALDALHIPDRVADGCLFEDQRSGEADRPPQPAHSFLQRLRGGWLGARRFYRDRGARPSAGRHFLHTRADARREATIHAPRRMPTVPQLE